VLSARRAHGRALCSSDRQRQTSIQSRKTLNRSLPLQTISATSRGSLTPASFTRSSSCISKPSYRRPPVDATVTACRVSSRRSSAACSHAEPWVGGSPVQTTYYYRRDTAEHVTVIRRHHPLEGQSLEVLKGGQHLIVRLRDGSTMRLLRSWTDADGPDVSQPSQLSTMFTIDSLRELIGLLEALRRRT